MGRRRIKHGLHVGSALVMVAILTALAGCGADEPPPAATAPPAIDPRYASAQGLIDHYNNLMSVQYPNVDEVLGLYHAENKTQELLLRLTELATADIKLQRAMLAQFDELFDPLSVTGLELAALQPARITTREDRRAEAQIVEWNGAHTKLYLVEIDQRWRLSGYTFEYDPYGFTPEDLAALQDILPFLERVVKITRTVSTELAPRIFAGEFVSPNGVASAYIKLILTYRERHPRDAQDLMEYMALHPELQDKLFTSMNAFSGR